VGEERIRVVTWLPDDPYPMALVETPPPGAPPSDDANALAEGAVRRALGFAADLGYDVPPLDDVLVGDPTTRQWQLAGMTPCGDADRQRILAEDDAERRGDLIAAAALDTAEILELRLQNRGDG
jgi:Lon protease-like protein